MATVLSPVPASMDPLWRITVDQYHAMIDAGILSSDSPVELVDGVLLQKMPKKPRHRIATHTARTAIEAALPAGWYADSQEPVTLPDSEPEPDITVARGNSADYTDSHPGPGDIALVVEVADSTLARDRGVKARAYARAGIPVYWLIDLTTDQVEIRSSPEGDAYRVLTIHPRGDSIPLLIEGEPVAAIAVSSVLPAGS